MLDVKAAMLMKPMPKLPAIEDALATGITLGLIVTLLHVPSAAVDLRIAYLPVARHNLHGFYNPYWLRPLLEGLARLPLPLAYGALMLASLGMIILSVRIFGGRLIHVLLTYQWGALLFYGQIDALVVLGLALGWNGYQKENPWIVGIGFVLAALKPQVSAVPLSLLWLWLPTNRQRIQSLLIPLLTIAATIWRYGWWIPEWLEYLQHDTLNKFGSITLWQFIGPLSLFLWVPFLFAKLPRREKLLFAVATSALAMPYFQQDSLVILQVFPIGWIAWIGNLGFLFILFRWQALKWVVLLPLAVYLCCLSKGYTDAFQLLKNRMHLNLSLTRHGLTPGRKHVK